MYSVLVVDDKPDIRALVVDILSDEGYKAVAVSTASEAIEEFKENNFSAVILDIWLEGSDFDGIGVLKTIKNINRNMPVIMISGHGNIEVAVNAIKLGAYDFIEKPFKAEKLLILLNRAINAYNLVRENSELKKDLAMENDYIAVAKSSLQLLKTAQNAAQTNARVLITGDHGAGKEILARFIHRHSTRNTRSFIHISCADLTYNQFESLFAKTTAGSNAGLDQFNAGTIYLSDIHLLSENQQSLLLSVLNDTSNDVRFIFSSPEDLKDLVSAGKFNKGLYYRINVLPLQIEPLKSRKDDIKALFKHFVEKMSKRSAMVEVELAPSAQELLEIYDWPGNVRELKNLAEWLLIMRSKDKAIIHAEDLPREYHLSATQKTDNASSWIMDAFSKPLKEARDIFEREYLLAQLSRCDGIVSKTADKIGIDRTALHRKMKNLDIANG